MTRLIFGQSVRLIDSEARILTTERARFNLRPVSEKTVTTRSIEFIAYFQLEAICHHLRNLVLSHIEPGPETRKVVKSLRDEFVNRTSGKPSERIPDVTADMSPADLLTVAEVVLATNVAFLTPKELEERKRIGVYSTAMLT